MEEKKKLAFLEQYSGQFRLLLEAFLGAICSFSDASFISSRFERWYIIFMYANFQFSFRPFLSYFFWFEWYNYDLFTSSFSLRRTVSMPFGPVLALGCFKIWRIFFACVGNRSLVGWRRVALIGFFTKLRFVTRYNYRKRGHYLWRRNQRRWRLFKSRRRLYFFIKRYRKLRRLRYQLSFNYSWRTKQRIQRIGLRWRGSFIQPFIGEFLRWRVFIISQRTPYGNVYRRDFWRRYSLFLFYRYQKGFRRFRYQPSSVAVSGRRKRLWRHKKFLILGRRGLSSRKFRRFNQSSQWLFRASRLRGFIKRYAVYKRRFSFSFRHFKKLRSIVFSCLRRRLALFPFKRARLTDRKRKLKKVRKLRRRHIAGFLRRFRINRDYLRVRKKRSRLIRRIRRRIKRRVRRRRKYSTRWFRSLSFSRERRRRNLRRQKYLFFQWKSLRRSTTHRFLPRFRKIFVYMRPSALPLISIVSLTRFWRGGQNSLSYLNKKAFNSALLNQRMFRARHLNWEDAEAPRYRRLFQFQRWRKLTSFGRSRRWMCSLFIRARRLFYYQERNFPIMPTFFPPQRYATLSDPAFVLPVLGARLESTAVSAQKRRFCLLLKSNFRERAKSRNFYSPFSNRLRRSKRKLLHLRRFRIQRKRRWFRKYRIGSRQDSWLMAFRLRRALFRNFKRQIFLRRFYSYTQLTTTFWLRRLRWHQRILRLRFYLRRFVRRRVMERFLYRTARQQLIFRTRILQANSRKFLVRRSWLRRFLLYRQTIRRQLMAFIRFRRLRRLSFLLRRRFRFLFFTHLKQLLHNLYGPTGVPLLRNSPFLRLELLALRNSQRSVFSTKRPAVLGCLQKPFGLIRRRSGMCRLSRYISPRGAGLFSAHALLTRRYPSVYDFETFNYLFSSSFLYNRFTRKGNRWRSQLIVMSVLRYLRPYSSFHLVRFIERFLVEGFPIYFELSSLKQSNKEQPFPVPINLSFFRTYMLKAIATRFRARRHAVSFQAALLTELWSWHVDPTASILHDFLVNHYAVGLDSRFFVHYRWKVKR